MQAGGQLQRCNTINYVIPSATGWILFLIFAGVGVAAGPIDWIQQFINRPTSVITKSEYMRRARIIAIRAKEVAVSVAGAGF